MRSVPACGSALAQANIVKRANSPPKSRDPRRLRSAMNPIRFGPDYRYDDDVEQPRITHGCDCRFTKDRRFSEYRYDFLDYVWRVEEETIRARHHLDRLERSEVSIASPFETMIEARFAHVLFYLQRRFYKSKTLERDVMPFRGSPISVSLLIDADRPARERFNACPPPMSRRDGRRAPRYWAIRRAAAIRRSQAASRSLHHRRERW